MSESAVSKLDRTPVRRLINSPPSTAAETLALQYAILSAVAEGESSATFRLFQVDPTAVLISHDQDLDEEVNRKYRFVNRLDVNRRITDGPATVVGPEQVGWEVFAPVGEDSLFKDDSELARTMCQAVTIALEDLGLQGKFEPPRGVLVNGREICTSGFARQGEVSLFQGWLLVEDQSEMASACLRRSAGSDPASHGATCLRKELGVVSDAGKVREALIAGFERAFTTILVRDEVSVIEYALYNDNLTRFLSNDWVDLTRARERPPF